MKSNVERDVLWACLGLFILGAMGCDDSSKGESCEGNSESCSIEPTQSIPDQYYKFVNSETWDDLETLFTSDVDLLAPYTFHAINREEAMGYYYDLPQTFPEHTDIPIKELAIDGQAAVLRTSVYTTLDGETGTFDAVDWYRYEDNKIKSLGIFMDPYLLPIVCDVCDDMFDMNGSPIDDREPFGPVASGDPVIHYTPDTVIDPVANEKMLETLDRYYVLVNSNQFDEFFTLFDPNVEFSAPQDNSFTDLESISEYYLEVPTAFPEHTDTPIEIIISGNIAVVLLQFDGTSLLGDQTQFLSVDWFVIEDGKIKSLKVLFDVLNTNPYLGCVKCLGGLET